MSEAGIPIKDAIRLKYEMARGITWAGMNAREIEEFKKFPDDQGPKIKAEYLAWYKSVTMVVMPAWLHYAIWGVGGAAAILAAEWRWIQAVAVAAILISLWSAARQQNQWEGYMYGYEAGYEAALNKALGLSEKDLEEIHEFGADMRMDEMVIKRWANESDSPGKEEP